MHRFANGSSTTHATNSGTLLYITDLVSDSDETLTSACELAESNCVDLELVHVVDIERELSNPDAQMGIQYRLETIARRLRSFKSNIAFRLLFGSPEDVISRRARDVKAKLIAFGRNSRSSTALQQRVVQRVKQRVSCPVVILPARAA